MMSTALIIGFKVSAVSYFLFFLSDIYTKYATNAFCYQYIFSVTFINLFQFVFISFLSLVVAMVTAAYGMKNLLVPNALMSRTMTLAATTKMTKEVLVYKLRMEVAMEVALRYIDP